MATYKITSHAMACGPGILRWCLANDGESFNRDVRNVAARLYAVASAFPNLPAGAALALASGEIKPVVSDDGETCTITWPIAQSNVARLASETDGDRS